MTTPANPLDLVRRLAADPSKCAFYTPVLAETRANKMDTDDLLEIIKTEIGELHCFDSQPTEKYYPGTTSDYYSYWVDECGCRMFIKLLVNEAGTVDEKLVVTSFKKDRRYDV